MKPKTPAPSMFQKATATKHISGHCRFSIHGARFFRRPFSQASWPRTISGTTSSALNDAPTAITGVVVPAKYRWWKVPGMPPSRNSDADARLAVVAMGRETRPMLENTKASAVVANTSKKPSTHRCTTHQRQYSITDRLVRSP
ncbi:hypothetical protein SDC9_125013 [bioreactor metagenome]|uniref:Uncharacterized protein n=1 Tax=bioreactor metagenome TaxID=1076179 RepID=A0A645CM27_9ZZZZ